MKIAYTTKRFSAEALTIIERANAIIADYESQGFNLTLRQLYYQFVAGDHFPGTWADKETGSVNNERSYKKLGDIINDARMCGLLDWDAIIDRTRSLRPITTWGGPSEIVEACSRQFKLDLWKDQPNRPEVWVEKDAAIGVVENVCAELRVPYFSCRGYTSQSAMWEAAQRILGYIEDGKTPMIIHLGDHDPSGVDMSRDIEARLNQFISHHLSGAYHFEFTRIALNMDQVTTYAPPPNPTKITDSRSGPYIKKFGHECWELDALEPSVVANLIRSTIEPLVIRARWNRLSKQEGEARKKLEKAAADLESGA